MKDNKYKNHHNNHPNGYKQNNRHNNRMGNDHNSKPDVKIRAPYNFVPICKSVFHPYGTAKNNKYHQISQDVPFKDGVSGKITFNFIAETPIFTKNADNGKISSFNYVMDSKGKKQYFIPGSSIKGCIRNVLEIMSFGKMSKVDNKSFGLRDLNNKDYRGKIKDVHCGWMEFKDNKASIEDWDIPGRISIDAISKHFGVKSLSELVKIEEFNRLAESEGRERVTSPLYKYKLLEGKTLKSHFSKIKVKNGRPIFRFDNKGKYEGTIVLTGQSGAREEKIRDGNKKWVGKIFEFIFFEPENTSPLLKVKDNVLKAFQTIHENSPAYTTLWRDKLKKGEKIPVFFRLDENKEVESIGLSFMYKYPYDKDTYSAMPESMFSKDLDLAEALFGYTINDSENHENDSALRGRVMFSNAMVVSEIADDWEQKESVREFPAYSPHSSYYPIYVKDGNDWNNAERIAGWKRYLVQSEPIFKKPNEDSPSNKDKLENKIKSTTFVKFLPKGTEFEMSVRFHNLRPFELGALLSAITFHGNHNNCFHSLGFGKGYGYGKIKVETPVLNILEYSDDGCRFNVKGIQDYLEDFETEMTSFKPDWKKSDQLRELIAIAGGWDENVGYMSLTEYGNAKKNKNEKSLKLFSELNTKYFQIPDHIDIKDSTVDTPKS